MIQVASYCRVSTDKEDQANSFASQQKYFRDYIDRQPDWELYKVYADEGITGTNTKKRVQFNRMISDAKMGKFKLIITKEVSRFSRNILDTIQFTRELRAAGVGVLFMNDGINTLEPDAELRLSIMGSIAQEESRKTSSRVKWGQTRQMERGVVFGRSMLGYDVKDGRMTVNPEGAKLVKLIFHKYGVEGKGTTVIARELREAGYLTYRDNPKWSNSHIVKILKNEKYVGDLVQKKTYTPDYLTHSKKYNYGAEDKVCLTDHHEAIIDRKLWNTVQAEIQRRNRQGTGDTGHGNRYLFSGKIKCGVCGEAFVSRRKYHKDGSYYKRWCCLTAVQEGTPHEGVNGDKLGCNIGILMRDDFAQTILETSLQTILKAPKRAVELVTAQTKAEIDRCESASEESSEELQQQIQQLKKRKEAVLDAFFSQEITKEEMRMMNERHDHQLEELLQGLQSARERESLSYETSMLKADVKRHIAGFAGCDLNELMLKASLNRMVVHPERRVALFLNLLPQKWQFVLDSMEQIHSCEGNQGCQIDSSVPTPTMKRHPLPKISKKVATMPLYTDGTGFTNGFGYLFSFKYYSTFSRRKELPIYEVHVGSTFPDKRFTGFRGYLYVQKGTHEVK